VREIGEPLRQAGFAEDRGEGLAVTAADLEPAPEPLAEPALRAKAVGRPGEAAGPGGLGDRQHDRLLVVGQSLAGRGPGGDPAELLRERLAMLLDECALRVRVDVAGGRGELEDLVDDRGVLGVVEHDLGEAPRSPDLLPEIDAFAERGGAGERVVRRGRALVGARRPRKRRREQQGEAEGGKAALHDALRRGCSDGTGRIYEQERLVSNLSTRGLLQCVRIAHPRRRRRDA